MRRLKKKIQSFTKKLRKAWDKSRKERQKRKARDLITNERRAKLRDMIAATRPLRLVVGASGVFEEGWIPTDMHDLNLLVESDWARWFKVASVDAIIAEHVWEHLTPEQGLLAAQNCHRYLKPGGYLRLAIPDGCSPDPAYIEHVRIGGSGPGADDHKVLYTYKSLSEMLTKAGFDVRLQEYYDDKGVFHAEDWDVKQGLVRRTKRFDQRNADGVLRYTSLMVDAIKAAP